MPGSRWDELDRAIGAKDGEAAERIWLELLEQEPGNVDGFLKAADGIMEKAGGRRQSGVLLWMVAGALKDKGKDRELVRLYVRLSRIAPDDGTLRTALTETVRRAYAGRVDLEALLERSGVVGGVPTEFSKQAETLERYLRLEPDAYVFHKTGWGIGRIVEYLPERGRCVIDFKSKPRHEMDILAAADLLERLPEDDLRVLAAYRRDELRLAAKATPLGILKKALARLGNDAPLRHVKDMLVPDAVEKTAWAGWWREAKKAALLDPSVKVGTGSDPRLSITDVAGSDFRSTVERQVAFAKEPTAKQSILREFARTTAGDAGAKAVLAELARAEMARCPASDAALRLSWALILSDFEGTDPTSSMAPSFAATPDPEKVLRGIPDDVVRSLAGRACLIGRPADGPELLLKLALEQDIALADIAADHYLASKRQDLLDRLLNPVFDEPESRPLLYRWAVHGLVRGRWPSRNAEPYRIAEQVIKVLDATAYRAKRAGHPLDAKAVDSIADLLADRNCRIVAEAAAGTDLDGARHLLRILRRNQGLKPRLQEKLTDTILRAHPTALREEGETEAQAAAIRSAEIYMTAAGIEKVKREYDRLIHEEMPANQAEIARAREFGDLSENAEYHAAREKQGMLLGREIDLKNLISLGREIRPEIVRTDAVSVGCRVRLKDEGGTEVTYSLLGPADVDMSRHIINYKTPLGQSLMGKKAGDTVVLDLMGTRHTYHVLEIGSAV